MAQVTLESRRYGPRFVGSHAAQGHALMFRLDDHPNTLGVQIGVEPVGNLLGQPLLHLQSSGKPVDDAGQLRQSDDALIGQIPDVRNSMERQHVVLTQRLERNVPSDDELLVALVVGERREVEILRRKQFGVRAGDPTRCLAQVF